MSPSKKSGFVTLVGRSNVGKSTLLNALIGSKVAIVTPKPQTTRRPVRGILNDPRGQIVFVDTPGFFLKTDPLSRRLNEIAREQTEGIEAIVYVVDPTRASGPEEEAIQKRLRSLTVPMILVVNKCDLPAENRPFMKPMRDIDVGQKMTIELSALKHGDLNRLVDALFDLLPAGELYYPEEQLTDMTKTEWVAELIREKALMRLKQELPYTVNVEILSDETQASGLRKIEARLWTTEERYKRMVIGAGGSMIKLIGSDARKELEAATGQKVYLELEVDVDREWQKRFV